MRTNLSWWVALSCLGASSAVGCYGGEAPDSVEAAMMEAEDVVETEDETYAAEDTDAVTAENARRPLSDLRAVGTVWESPGTSGIHADSDDGTGTLMMASAWEARATDTNGASTRDAGAEEEDE